MDSMTEPEIVTQAPRLRISWYRTKVERGLLAELNRRSNFLGALQTLSYLATLTAMQDGPLREAYMNLAGSCGRALANTFRDDVRKAQSKTK